MIAPRKCTAREEPFGVRFEGSIETDVSSEKMRYVKRTFIDIEI